MKPDLRRSIVGAADSSGNDRVARYFTREQWQSILDTDAQLRRLRRAAKEFLDSTIQVAGETGPAERELRAAIKAKR